MGLTETVGILVAVVKNKGKKALQIWAISCSLYVQAIISSNAH